MQSKMKGIEYVYEYLSKVGKLRNGRCREIGITLITQSITVLYWEIGYMNVDRYVAAGFGRTFR